MKAVLVFALVPLVLLLAAFVPVQPETMNATCSPVGICRACTNCKYCKNCSSGGSCSVCR